MKKSTQYYLIQRFPLDLISNFIFMVAIINKTIITTHQIEDFKHHMLEGEYD